MTTTILSTVGTEAFNLSDSAMPRIQSPNFRTAPAAIAKVIGVLILLMLSLVARPVAAQSLLELAISAPILILANGTNGEQVIDVFVVNNHFKSEDSCQSVSFTVKVVDPNGIAAPIEQAVELTPSSHKVVNLSFEMVGPPNSARVLTVSDYQQVGSCNLRAARTIKDVHGATVGGGNQAAGFSGRSDYGAFIDAGLPSGVRRGVIVGSAALAEKAVFGFYLAKRQDMGTVDYVTDENAEPCEGLSVRFTASDPTGYVAQKAFDVDLDPEHRFAELEIPFAEIGDIVSFEIKVTNSGPSSGSCRLAMGARQTAADGGTRWYWAAGTSMSAPHLN